MCRTTWPTSTSGRVHARHSKVLAWATLLGAALAFGCSSAARAASDPPAVRPNVVIVMTDDQGFGDLGAHGNPVVRTPNIDALAGESARLLNFYVSPVCTPTRAALMTGRYCQRTTAVDTWIGRAMLAPEEVTIAELLRDAGWATGIFGKWHLGDCYPMRAIDQGFDTALVHRGGGIGQPSDPEGGEGKYTDAVLFRDGERVETAGYCTDVYFDAALAWMREQHEAERPFFAYIATNAPHGPYHDVPEELRTRYAARELTHAQFPDLGYPLEGKLNADVTARIFAMLENIDANVGRLVRTLEAMDARRDTLLIYLHDNGPQQRRYNAGLRGIKGSVHEGGVRSPLLASWPARLRPETTSDRIAAHVDLLPTVLDACSVPLPDGLELDGRSVLPLLQGAEEEWPDRALFVQAHRGNEPVRWANAMVRTQDWKLVSATGFGREMTPDEPVEPAFELFDMRADSFERTDVAAAHPDVVADLAARYDAWFDGVEQRGPERAAPPAIAVGADAAPRVVLTRQDWRRTEGRGWGPRGHWWIDVAAPGPYRVRVRAMRAEPAPQLVTLHGAGPVAATWTAADERTVVLDGVTLAPGAQWLEVTVRGADGKVEGPHQVIVERIDAPAQALVPVPSTESRGQLAGWGAGRTWIDQHHDINAYGERGGTYDLVLLGDSITQSFGGPGRSVGAAGGAALARHLADRRIANMGISGDGTEEVLWRLAHGNLDGLDARAVMLMIGTNNLSAGDAPADVALGIAAIVARIAALQPGARIVLVPVLPRGEANAPMRAQVDAVNEQIRGLAERPGVTWLDMAPALLEPDGTLRRSCYAGDGLHLAPAGYEAWAAALAEVLGAAAPGHSDPS